MSHGSRPTLAACLGVALAKTEVFLSSLAVIPLVETACAFLNSDGGWLMFGIAPNLKITGQNVTDATRQEIANALQKPMKHL